jgi:hypothetical protein
MKREKDVAPARSAALASLRCGSTCRPRRGLEKKVGALRAPDLDAHPTTQIRAGCAGPDAAAKENMFLVKLKTASGVFTWDLRLHPVKITRKLRTALRKTGRVTTMGRQA